MALGSVMTGSTLDGLQLSLGVINIPAAEILACAGKHDKTVTHRAACSEHRLSFVWRGAGSTKEIKNNPSPL